MKLTIVIDLEELPEYTDGAEHSERSYVVNCLKHEIEAELKRCKGPTDSLQPNVTERLGDCKGHFRWER